MEGKSLENNDISKLGNSDVRNIESSDLRSKKHKRTLGKRAALGAALLFASAGELNPPQESFDEMKARAKTEMSAEGITSEQKEAYKPGVNDLLYRGINPYGGQHHYYADLDGKSLDLKDISISAMEVLENLLKNRDKSNIKKEDAWRLYLGLPQVNGTFDISDYQPSVHTKEKYYFKFTDPESELPDLRDIKRLIELLKNGYLDEFSTTNKPLPYGGMGNVMGNFKWSLGKDDRGTYVSYYDLWDLDIPVEEGSGFFGKPFEIYDRIYYDPKTFEIVK